MLSNPGTKAAPAKFKGGFSEVKGFLKYYEKLYSEKCESITHEFVEGLASFRTPNWSMLKNMQNKKIPSLMAWKRYVRGFIRIGGWLEQANKLTNEEYTSYFWEGIYKKLRANIESCLMSSEPDRDLSLAFPVDKVDSDTDTGSSTEETSENSSDSDSSKSEQEFFLKNHKTQGTPNGKKGIKKTACKRLNSSSY
ncbi:hypothetical protein BDR03DRAFT_936046 [Suillus americanus]|nr:hypothetical protein BDR03DRAFT_936046 [Suillus americanus]